MTWALAAAAGGLWRGNTLWRRAVMVAAATSALALIFPPARSATPSPVPPGVSRGQYIPAYQPNVSVPPPPGGAAPPLSMAAPAPAPMAPAAPAPAGPVKIGAPSVKPGEAVIVGPSPGADPVYRPPATTVIQPRRAAGDGAR